MPCYHPITGFYARDVNKSGKRSIVFRLGASLSGVGVKLPCGQCIGCRLERSRQWAMRCMHEKRLWRDSEFLTLTYDDRFLPAGNSLVKRHFQLFMKRLRKEYGNGIRFFGCGEYGEHSRRPHYHIVLFNLCFPDKRFYKFSEGGERLYSSASVADLWPFGFNVIGDVTFDSCAYVARYVCGKITGEKAAEHYGCRECEFVLMSRRPGLGTGWFEKYGEETYLHDNVVFNNRLMQPPRFYDLKMDGIDSVRMDVIKRERRRRALRLADDNTLERRRVKERVALLNLARLKREV